MNTKLENWTQQINWYQTVGGEGESLVTTAEDSGIEGEDICLVYGDDSTQADERARLIAQAPRILRALKAALELYDDLYSNSADVGEQEVFEHARSVIKDAIGDE